MLTDELPIAPASLGEQVLQLRFWIFDTYLDRCHHTSKSPRAPSILGDACSWHSDFLGGERMTSEASVQLLRVAQQI